MTKVIPPPDSDALPSATGSMLVTYSRSDQTRQT